MSRFSFYHDRADDTESLIGIMGNEHLCLKFEFAGLEPGNGQLITPSLKHWTTTSLIGKKIFFRYVNTFFFQIPL